MSWETWLTVFIVSFFVVISPGPNLAVTIKNSLVYSRTAGIYTTIGMAVGSLVHITYCLVGIGVIISKSILLFNALKWLGAAYLIYIGIKSLSARKQDSQEVDLTEQHQVNYWSAFRVGLLTDLLNPKATLFFLALFTQIISPGTPLAAQILYGLTMVGLEIVWYSLMAVLITHQLVRNQFLSVSHIVERVTGLVLIGLGIRLAFTANKS